MLGINRFLRLNEFATRLYYFIISLCKAVSVDTVVFVVEL